MDSSDLKVPMDLLEASRPAVLLYVMCALHADDNGSCESSRYVAAMAGLPKDEYEAARDELVGRGLAAVIHYQDVYGTGRGLRLLKWSGPRKHDRLGWAEWKKIRETVFERDGYTCAYCNSEFPPSQLECDHVDPISQGGTNEMGNLVTACSNCNRRKRDKVVQILRVKA